MSQDSRCRSYGGLYLTPQALTACFGATLLGQDPLPTPFADSAFELDESAWAREPNCLTDRALEAKQLLVECRFRLLVRIASDYQALGLAQQDLVQEGNLALIAAAERYDPAKGRRFSTYASKWACHAITHAVVDHTLTLERPAGMERNNSRHELVTDPSMEDPQERVAQLQLRSFLEHLLDDLPAPDGAVLRLRFGLADSGPCTLSEIAAKFGPTRQRIYQIQLRALRKLEGPCRRKQLEACMA